MKNRSLLKKIVIVSGLLLVLFMSARIIDSFFSRDRATINTDAALRSEAQVAEYSYGTHPKETLSVFDTANATSAPIIVMVHSAAWQIGDKDNDKVVINKLNYWGAEGYLFISINYPMIPDGVAPDAQADAVAAALTYIQQNAAVWGGDATRMVVMGHSAGAHLVALVSATRDTHSNLAPWEATILLDTAAYDIKAVMESSPSRLYEQAFGNDAAYWLATSPPFQLKEASEPHFVVCSSNRAPHICNNAEAYTDALTSFGTSATLYKVALSHEAINSELGLESDYTTAVDDFIKTALE